MRLALIGDLHYGIRNDSIVILDNNKRFFDDVFFPTLKQEGINTVVCLGDLVDRRKYINYYTAHRLRTDFMEAMWQNGVYQFFWILGNHDVYWRQTLEVNAATELYRNKSWITLVDEPKVICFNDTKVLMLPWICDTNRQQSLDLINTTEAKIVFGHLELDGFEMYKGVVNYGGDNRDLFKKFDAVYSGHYHHKSTDGRIFYLGAHSEFIWSDYHDDRGFHIFDCDTRTISFIKNPYTLFYKVFYDDAAGEEPVVDFTQLTGKYVKVIVRSRTNSDQYNTFMSQCEKAQPFELTVVEDHLNLHLQQDNTIVSETKSTLDIIREYVATTNNVVNSDKLDKLIVNLFHKAQEQE